MRWQHMYSLCLPHKTHQETENQDQETKTHKPYTERCATSQVHMYSAAPLLRTDLLGWCQLTPARASFIHLTITKMIII